jgi:hypothetical protein
VQTFRAEGALLEAHGLNTENWNQSKSASPANFCAPKAIENFVFAHFASPRFHMASDLSRNGALAASYKKLAVAGRLSGVPVKERSELTDQHLKELGIALGDRLKMLRAIREPGDPFMRSGLAWVIGTDCSRFGVGVFCNHRTSPAP